MAKNSAPPADAPVEKYPSLRAMFDRLTAEKEAIRAASAPLRAKRDALLAQIQPLEAEEREIIRQIHAIERPKLAQIDTELGALARAMGGKSLSAGSAEE